jgi:hypothetical protein
MKIAKSAFGKYVYSKIQFTFLLLFYYPHSGPVLQHRKTQWPPEMAQFWGQHILLFFMKINFCCSFIHTMTINFQASKNIMQQCK